MMNQFEVIKANGGIRYLTVIDTSRWDYWWGFHRVIKPLLPEIEDTPRFAQLEENYYNRSF